MTERVCSIPECGAPVRARGWCNAHYKRWSKYGDPLRGRAAQPAACTVDGCERPTLARSMCAMHYARWRTYGDPERAQRIRFADADAAFAACTETETGCLEWAGGRNPLGYGRVTVDGERLLAHRVAWERAHGPIPAGAVLDHTCYNPPCVNVDHLRIATHAQNEQNRSGPMSGRKHNLPRGVVPHGPSFRGQVKHRGMQHMSPSFATVAEADQWAQATRARLFGEWAGRN